MSRQLSNLPSNNPIEKKSVNSTSLILALETSCDETAISIVKLDNGILSILSNEISSQVKLHAKWGGVVPNLAAREHVKNITLLLELSLKNSGVDMKDIDAIAVTHGPGLIPALMVGAGFAKTLAYIWDKPLIGIHHIEGHIHANFIGLTDTKLRNEFESTNNNFSDVPVRSGLSDTKFPILCLVVSGGHTQLVFMKDHFKYEIIGQTVDDAVGEAFDKVARILGIGYPGGPHVAQWASKFQKTKFEITFPRPMLNKKNFNFSFSGLKTAVLYETKKHPELLKDKAYISEICHEFQQACVDVLVSKTIKAAEQYKPITILLAGGVSANKELRKQLGTAITNNFTDISYRVPEIALTGDNAAMIGAAAALRWEKMSEAKKKKAMNGWKDIQPSANLKMK